MSRKLLTLGPAFLILLLGCSTIQTTSDRQSAVRSVPCVEITNVPYHAPTNQADADSWLAGTLPDPSNLYDTPNTVSLVRKNNAARRAICGP